MLFVTLKIITCYSSSNVLRLVISRYGVDSMSYTELMKLAKSNKLPPVILLYGTESFFIQNLQKQIVSTVISDNDQENLSTYDLEEVPIEEAIIDAETYPFFGDKKLLILHNPSFLTAKQVKLPFEHHIKQLEHYLKQPVDYSVIVFIAPYEKLDNRKKITKLLRKHALVAECNPIKDYDVKKWIKTLADELDITLNSDAYEILEGELIINLHLIQKELQKMATYVGENGVVTKEIAENLVSHTADSSALRLVDAVLERDLAKVMLIQQDLKKMKEEPIGLIALLAFQFRTILRVKLLKEKGYSQFQIQKQIGGHPYVIKIAGDRERRFTVKRLSDIVSLLTDTDAAIKQGKVEKYLGFELLLFDLVEMK